MQMTQGTIPILKIVDIYNYFALKTVVVYFSFEMLSNNVLTWNKNNASRSARGEKPLILSVVPLKQFNLGLGSTVPVFRLKHCNRRSKQPTKKTLINFISKFKIWTVWIRQKKVYKHSSEIEKTISAKEGPCAL